MLVELSIRDFILIDSLSLSFDKGLSALTGETGAGKSILLDALGVVLGTRSDNSLVRPGAEQATITAEFSLGDDHPVLSRLKEQGLEPGPSLLMRRIINSDGRSRAFVNDQPVTVGFLRQLKDDLVEIHGQFDTQGLLNPETHRDFLDAFGELHAIAHEVAQAYSRWQKSERSREEAESNIQRLRQEEDFLRHAVQELDTLNPEEGEEQKLLDRRQLLMNAEKLMDSLARATEDLSGHEGAERRLLQAQKTLGRLGDKMGDMFVPLLAALDRASAELTDAIHLLESLSHNVTPDPRGLEQTEERLFALRALARKHSTSVDALPLLRADMARRLQTMDNEGDELQRLARETFEALAAYRRVAEKLSQERQKAAQSLDKAVAKELKPLKLDKALFKTQITPLSESEWGGGGIDRVMFTVSTNAGMPAGPLNRIASGGELARFMLALKVVLAHTEATPTLIFDEVDTGIGGAVADAVGDRLNKLSKHFQVLVVTHSPQVAARAHTHLSVQKETRKQVVVTTVKALTTTERREEIARMLSGANITDQARAAADSLLQAS